MVVIKGKPARINIHKPISSILNNVIQLFLHKQMKKGVSEDLFWWKQCHLLVKLYHCYYKRCNSTVSLPFQPNKAKEDEGKRTKELSEEEVQTRIQQYNSQVSENGMNLVSFKSFVEVLHKVRRDQWSSVFKNIPLSHFRLPMEPTLASSRSACASVALSRSLMWRCWALRDRPYSAKRHQSALMERMVSRLIRERPSTCPPTVWSRSTSALWPPPEKSSRVC